MAFIFSSLFVIYLFLTQVYPQEVVNFKSAPSKNYGDDDYPDDDYEVTCLSDEFLCEADGICILKTSLCNGVSDCPDGSDESNCTVASTTLPPTTTTDDYSYYGIECGNDEFNCGDYCIENSLVCNGEEDCIGGKDETECDVVPSPNTTESNISVTTTTTPPPTTTDPFYEYEDCSDDTFDCGDGLCINMSLVCDQYSDCDDGRDEATCTHIPTTIPPTTSDIDYESCASNEFLCGDGACIPEGAVCDNIFDCDEGSDETNCPVRPETTASTAVSTSSSSTVTSAEATTGPAQTTPLMQTTSSARTTPAPVTGPACYFNDEYHPAGTQIVSNNCTEISCSQSGRLLTWINPDPTCGAVTTSPPVTYMILAAFVIWWLR